MLQRLNLPEQALDHDASRGTFIDGSRVAPDNPARCPDEPGTYRGQFGLEIADILIQRIGILVFGNLSFAVFVFVGSWTEQVMLNAIAMGVFSGVAVGAMMSLPSLVLSPGTRAVGMGIFFTGFYICSAVGPMIAGWMADLTGDIASTFQFAVALLIAAVLVLPLYHRLTARALAQ